MDIESWHNQVEEWRIKYGVPKPKIRSFNPSKVSAICKKCEDNKRRMNRHHKANDYFFATILPDVYAKRYIEFRPNDCDKLCESCHGNWHNYVKPKTVQMYIEWREIAMSESLFDKKELGKWCEKWRVKILNWYIAWLDKPVIKHGKKRKKRRAKAAKKQSSSYANFRSRHFTVRENNNS